jgi:hypothetical protein
VCAVCRTHCALVTLAEVSAMLRPDCAQAKWGEGDTRCDAWRRPHVAAVACAAPPGAPRCLGRT